jgi:FlaA1/EpsC-like NDP-sugar epimerase
MKEMNEKNMGEMFKFKNILVTGGTGTIGKELVKKLLEYNPKVIRVLSNDENSLFNFQQEVNEYNNIRFLVGDVRDKERLRRAVQDIHIIYHVAALKHVPLCEYNPFEAIKTNVMGTQNLIEEAIDNNVEKMITISTDKAVNPTNVLGATKLLAERLTIAANYFKGVKKTVFSCVRFGNVLDSRGSVIRVFKKQIQNGGPLTLTDPNMMRFVMSIDRAIELILKSTRMANGEEIFIFKMPALHIKKLAKVLIQKLAPKYGYEPKNIKIKITGLRKGEKLYERLLSEEESVNSFEIEDMIVVLPQSPKIPAQREYIKKTTFEKFTCKDTHELNEKEIEDLLEVYS